MDRISAHISYEEATLSPTATRLGIVNVPNELQLQAMRVVAEQCFEPLRAHFYRPLHISSFFRCPALNTAVGGSPTSDHQNGCAIDIQRAPESAFTNADIFHWARQNLKFDQLIWEFGTNDQPAWVHISFRNDRVNRQEVRRKLASDNPMKHWPW